MGVPLQELLGWTVAISLAAYCGDRLLRRCGQSSDAYRTTLLAGLGMAAVCLAVESAAEKGGWWSWSLAHSRADLLPFPGIALVDWAFVAIDFLLPFELWRRRAPLGQRLLALSAFPIHLAGHAFTAKLPGPFPLSAFDLVHVGLVAAVVARRRPRAKKARGRRSKPNGTAPGPSPRRRSWSAPRRCSCCWRTRRISCGPGCRCWGAAALAVSFRREAEPRGEPLRRPRAAWLFAGLLVLGLALRLPGAHRDREFEQLLRQAAGQLVAKEAGAARVALDAALALKPEHSEALWLLGWAELQQGDRQNARRHLEAALAQRPDSAEAARLLAILDRQEGR